MPKSAEHGESHSVFFHQSQKGHGNAQLKPLHQEALIGPILLKDLLTQTSNIICIASPSWPHSNGTPMMRLSFVKVRAAFYVDTSSFFLAAD